MMVIFLNINEKNNYFTILINKIHIYFPYNTYKIN